MSTMTPTETPSEQPRAPRRAVGGSMASRVEAASRTRAPSPKGRGIVLIVLGLVVMYALIETFMGKGAVTRTVEENHPEGPGPKPVAPDASGRLPPVVAPTDPPSVVIAPAQRPDVELPDGLPDAITRDLQLNLDALYHREGDYALFVEVALAALPAVVDATPVARRAEVHSVVLEHVAAVAEERPFLRAALEAAAWLARADSSGTALTRLILVARGKGLDDDAAAPAALELLGRLPDRGGAVAVAAMDRLILDSSRPLHVRVAAARTRPADGRPAKVSGLADDPATHPALREALRAP